MKVSIVTITYNQEKYIAQALDSFVSQKVDFPFEVIVADDGSTDKTRDIVEEYSKKYPKIIKPLFRKKNMGAWNNFTDALKKAKGDYIALCEGDDFWTDINKLQIQANYLDSHNSVSLCFHRVKVFFENNSKPESLFPDNIQKNRFNLYNLLKSNFIQTNSVMYRRQDYSRLVEDVMPGDWYLHLFHLQYGKIGFIDKVMSSYRRHEEGIWWESDKDIDQIWMKYGIGHMHLYVALLDMYGSDKKREAVIMGHIHRLYKTLIDIDNKFCKNFTRELIDDYPDLTDNFVLKYFIENNKLISGLESQNHELADLLCIKNEQLKAVNNEILLLKSSIFWKIRNKVAMLLGKDVI